MKKDNAQPRARSALVIQNKYSTTSTIEVFNSTQFDSLTMSSRELAELTNKRHPDVKRDIENMFLSLKIDVSKFAHIYFDSSNRKQAEYLLDREHTECLLTGYSASLRMSVIRRWRELEAAGAPSSVPLTYSQALRLAADQADEIERSAQEVNRLNRVANDLASQFVEGLTISAFCKQLNGVNTQKVQNCLVEKQMLITCNEGYRPSGYSRDKYFAYQIVPLSFGKTSHRAVVLPKGAKYLYKLYHNNELPMKKDWNGEFTTHQLTLEDLTVHQQ
jgi:phage regulator Rha-like protein